RDGRVPTTAAGERGDAARRRLFEGKGRARVGAADGLRRRAPAHDLLDRGVPPPLQDRRLQRLSRGAHSARPSTRTTATFSTPRASSAERILSAPSRVSRPSRATTTTLSTTEASASASPPARSGGEAKST